MNVDQIVDKRTIAIPGPASTVPGPQGLPGVNAAPADDAVAGYISTTGTSKTAQALTARVDQLRPAIDVTALGIDNTAARDVSPALQSVIDSMDSPALYFPAGKYVVDTPIVIPRHSVYPISVQCSPNAIFTTFNEAGLDAFFDLGLEGDESTGTPAYQWEGTLGVDGGIFLCRGIVKSAIRGGYHSIIRNTRVYDAHDVGIDVGVASEILDNYIWDRNSHATGIRCANDSYVRGNKIFWCDTGVVAGDNTRVHDNNIWSGMITDRTTGIVSLGVVNYLNITGNYLDTINIGVDASNVAQQLTLDSNLFFYSASDGYNDLDYIAVKTADGCLLASNGNAFENLSARQAIGIAKNVTDMSALDKNTSNDLYYTHRYNLSPLSYNNLRSSYTVKTSLNDTILANTDYCIGYIPRIGRPGVVRIKLSNSTDEAYIIVRGADSSNPLGSSGYEPTSTALNNWPSVSLGQPITSKFVSYQVQPVLIHAAAAIQNSVGLLNVEIQRNYRIFRPIKFQPADVEIPLVL